MDKEVNNIQDFIQDEISKLDRSIVATPQDRDHLESFAKANQGSSDLLLMQMAINFGYKMALENVPLVSIMDKETLKEQLQQNLLQVFEDITIADEAGDLYSNSVRDRVLDHMCDVVIKTVNEA